MNTNKFEHPESERSSHDSLSEFSKNVKAFRKLRGLTQSELAQSAKVDRKTISRIENSAYSPTLTSLFSIAEALEVDPKELL